jgi:hypothetical protein
VRNSVGKVVMECVIETKASTILQFIDGLRGDLRGTFEEGTWAAWLYDLLKPHVSEVLVCNTRKNGKDGSKSDRIDACKLSEMLYMNNIKSVYHGQHGLRTLKELARSYLTITKDLGRVMNRLKVWYRSWAIPCGGKEVYGDTDAKVHAGLGRKLLMNRGQSHNQIQWAGARRTETPHPSCTQAPWERRLASLLFR